MNYEFYEVWGIEEDGFEELLETTSSKTQAEELAQANLGLGYFQTVIYLENEQGDLAEINRFEHS
jgi:hypothetical protein